MTTDVGDETGKFTMGPASPMPEGSDPRQRPWYRDAVKADAGVPTDPFIDAATNDRITRSAVPVKRQEPSRALPV